jgi:hypothetical protein
MEREREQATGENQPSPVWGRLSAARRQLVPVVRGVAFWSAILLPWVVIALLYTGFAMNEPELFTGLVVLNVVSAVAGGKYQHSL